MLDHSIISFLSFVCPLMSPYLPQSIAKHPLMCARGWPASCARRGIGQGRQPPTPPPHPNAHPLDLIRAGVCVALEGGVVWRRWAEGLH